MLGDHKAVVSYSIRFGIGAVLYSVGVFVGLRWARSLGESPWRFVVVLLPMIGVAVCTWAIMRISRETDEMQARKVLEALVISAAGTVIASMAYGFMEEVGAPHISLMWVTVVWAFFFGVGMLWSTWRYR
ncbi:hypothetical protein OFA60_06575 [Actinomyces naeslundii]|uniref:Uncharacterized protein n=1 Tax=Actinomyces naeslundii TaxID=1655 RepID=A0AA47INB2_ACTNA|nr:hypothetical protein [Actinomyces naeslundii]WAL41750.1 hypothetical protein OFA60_06575 [Actinomyces naeslundii]